MLNRPLLPLNPELFTSAVKCYQDALTKELPPDAIDKVGLLMLVLRERFRLTGCWNGLAEEIQPREATSSIFNIWKTPLTCVFSFAPDPLMFFKGLLPSNTPKIKDNFRVINQILFCNPLSNQEREEFLFQLMATRPAEEQISWLNLLEMKVLRP